MTALYECRKVLDRCLQSEWNRNAHPWTRVFSNQEWYETLSDMNVPANHPDRMVRSEEWG